MRAVNRRSMRWGSRRLAVAALLAASAGAAEAQSCTTQAKMAPQQRMEIGAAAYALGTAVAAGDAGRVRAGAVAQYAGDVNQMAYMVRSTGERLGGDQLAVTQVYVLDATSRTAGESAPAEFGCNLAGTVAETDFSINGLPSGRFAFALVEARGPHPWLLAFLLEQQGGSWKMAGFYPHARTAAGHDGLWYWTAAREDAKSNKPWLAWLLYGEAEQLLRPAAFVTSSNLDKLLTEQRTAAPQMLASGLSEQTPLTVQGPGGMVYRVTALRAESEAGEGALHLVMHLQVQGPPPAAEEATARNVAAGRALLLAHPELRESFTEIAVIADGPGGPPFVVQRPVAQLMAGAGSQ